MLGFFVGSLFHRASLAHANGGQDRTGQDRTGQDRTGQDTSVRTEPCG